MEVHQSSNEVLSLKRPGSLTSFEISIVAIGGGVGARDGGREKSAG